MGPGFRNNTKRSAPSSLGIGADNDTGLEIWHYWRIVVIYYTHAGGKARDIRPSLLSRTCGLYPTTPGDTVQNSCTNHKPWTFVCLPGATWWRSSSPRRTAHEQGARLPRCGICSGLKLELDQNRQSKLHRYDCTLHCW